MENGIDLNKELSTNPLATFYIKVKGNSMIEAGINDKDVLVVDRSLEPQNNKIAICFIDDEFIVKRIQKEEDCLYLMPENPNYSPIKVTEENELIIWGIVTYVIISLWLAKKVKNPEVLAEFESEVEDADPQAPAGKVAPAYCAELCRATTPSHKESTPWIFRRKSTRRSQRRSRAMTAPWGSTPRRRT